MKCPKCKSEDTKTVTDTSDKFDDLCLVCNACGYDERKQKQALKKHPEECQCADCLIKAIDTWWDLEEGKATGN